MYEFMNVSALLLQYTATASRFENSLILEDFQVELQLATLLVGNLCLS